MTKDSINLVVEPRKVVGKKVKDLRREGLVPAVLHNHGKESTYLEAKYPELEKVVNKAGKHAPVDLTIGSRQELALIKDLDVHPTKRTLRHVVFQAIRRDQKTEAEIPLNIAGEIPAERAGLLVLRTLDHVIVEALPRDLPDELTVDGSKLVEVGDRLSVSDIVLPPGVTLLTDPDQGVVVVEEPKDQIAEAEAAAAELAAAEGALEGAEGEEGETAEGKTEDSPAGASAKAEGEKPAE